MICTYPVNNIIPTILDSGNYGKWMNDLLEIYDGVIFARKFWKGSFQFRLIYEVSILKFHLPMGIAIEILYHNNRKNYI
jgi:hypothetical protein